MAWIDFKAVRLAASLEAVLTEMYKLPNLKREGDRLVGPCPVHSGQNPRAFHADLVKNVWHCFSQCQGGGNQLDFVAKREGIAIREAALKVAEFFHLDTSGPPPLLPLPRAGAAEPDATPEAPGPPRCEDTEGAPRNPPLDVRLVLSPDHPHLAERGLSKETTQQFGLGYCAKGILRGMIAIPIEDAAGTLVAYAGRRLRPEDIREDGKYKFPKGFRKELVLYNLHRVKGRERVILVEGFFAVAKLHDIGFPDTVATMGVQVSEHQLHLLAEFREVIVLFDGDEAGRTGAAAVEQALAERTIARVIELPVGTKPDGLSARVLRWLVNGASQLDFARVAFVPRSTG